MVGAEVAAGHIAAEQLAHRLAVVVEELQRPGRRPRTLRRRRWLVLLLLQLLLLLLLLLLVVVVVVLLLLQMLMVMLQVLQGVVVRSEEAQAAGQQFARGAFGRHGPFGAVGVLLAPAGATKKANHQRR